MVGLRFVTVSILLATLCFPCHLIAGEVSKTNLLQKQDLVGLRGKEGLVLTVSYSPGESSPAHRHKAHTFVYVLEGAIIMQVEGGEPVTLHEGETFYESPADIHIVSKNASDLSPAKFLVFFVKDKGVPPVFPVK